MIRVTDNHLARLLRMNPALVVPAMGEELQAGAVAICEDAIHSILDGAISGSGHIASLPGEAPNADTHDLDEHIHPGELIETTGQIKASAISDSDHAWIELGGSKMEPRPYMEPATERQRRDVIEAVHRRFQAEVGII